MNQHKSDKLYPLGPQENLMYQVYEQFDGEGVGGFIVRIKGDICSDVLRQSLNIVQHRHPKLRCRITFNDSGISCFEVVSSPPPVPLKIFESHADHLRWQEVTQATLYPPISTRIGPLMRISVLKHTRHGICDLILGVHHSIIDGRSLFILAHDILTAYESLQARTLTENVVPLPLMTGDLIKLSLRLPQKIKTFLSLYRFIPQLRLKRWAALPAGSGHYIPLWERSILSEADTHILRQKCRFYRATITGAIFSAAVLALRQMLGGNRHCLACLCPVDLDGLSGCRFGSENIASFVSTYIKMCEISSRTDFWEFARQTIRDLKLYIDSQGPAMAFNMMRFLKFRPGRIPRRDNLSINNLGFSALRPQYGSLSVEEISMVNRRQFLGVSIMVFFCKVNGCLNITFDGVDIPQDFFIKFQNEVMNILKNQS